MEYVVMVDTLDLLRIAFAQQPTLAPYVRRKTV